MPRRSIRKLARSHLPAIIRHVIGMAAMFLLTAVCRRTSWLASDRCLGEGLVVPDDRDWQTLPTVVVERRPVEWRQIEQLGRFKPTKHEGNLLGRPATAQAALPG
jgi:hypothetical protein